MKDAEGLTYDLYEYIASTAEVGPQVYKVTGTEPGKQLYARDTGQGWVFVSDRAATLATVPADPAALLGGMESRYDIALRLSIRSIPEKQGSGILNALKQAVKSHERIAALITREKAKALLAAATALDEVTLGWSQHGS